MIRPDMAIYPVEFYRRSEEKWKRRARARGATRNLFGSSARVPNEVWPLTKKATISWPDGRAAPNRPRPREYRALEQPVHGRLAALLKKLAGLRPNRV
jgi:hypothetical protein